eukprot:1841954-Pyramimonas_sp.AAC.1
MDLARGRQNHGSGGALPKMLLVPPGSAEEIRDVPWKRETVANPRTLDPCLRSPDSQNAAGLLK